MSYVTAESLQKAVFAALVADVELQSLTQGKIFDALPSGDLPDVSVQLGAEITKGFVDGSGAISRHDFVLSIVSKRDAFSQIKEIAARVSEVLHGTNLTLERGRLVGLNFVKANARKRRGARGRQLDLTFRALIDAI